MFHGGIAVRLAKLASAAVGTPRGGLGITNTSKETAPLPTRGFLGPATFPHRLADR